MRSVVDDDDGSDDGSGEKNWWQSDDSKSEQFGGGIDGRSVAFNSQCMGVCDKIYGNELMIVLFQTHSEKN